LCLCLASIAAPPLNCHYIPQPASTHPFITLSSLETRFLFHFLDSPTCLLFIDSVLHCNYSLESIVCAFIFGQLEFSKHTRQHRITPLQHPATHPPLHHLPLGSPSLPPPLRLLPSRSSQWLTDTELGDLDLDLGFNDFFSEFSAHWFKYDDRYAPVPRKLRGAENQGNSDLSQIDMQSLQVQRR